MISSFPPSPDNTDAVALIAANPRGVRNICLHSEGLQRASEWPQNNVTVLDRGRWFEIRDFSPTQFGALRQNFTGIASNSSVTVNFKVKKDNIPDTTRFPVVRIQRNGGTTSNHDISFDTQDGSNNPHVVSGVGTIPSAGVADRGDHWEFFMISDDAGGNTGIELSIFPAAGANADLATYTASTEGTIYINELALTETASLSPYVRTQAVAKYPSGGFTYDLKYALQSKLGLTDAQGLRLSIDDLWKRYLEEIKGTEIINYAPHTELDPNGFWAQTSSGDKTVKTISPNELDQYGRKRGSPWGCRVRDVSASVLYGINSNTIGVPARGAPERFVSSAYIWTPVKASGLHTCRMVVTAVGGAAQDTQSVAHINFPVGQGCTAGTGGAGTRGTDWDGHRVGDWTRVWAAIQMETDNTQVNVNFTPQTADTCSVGQNIAWTGHKWITGIQTEQKASGGPSRYVPNPTAVPPVSGFDIRHNPLNDSTFTLD